MANESRTGADLPKGIVGIKASEYLAPEKAAQIFPDYELPEGARAYMKEKSIPFGGQIVVVNIYRLVEDGGLKNNKQWVGKMSRRPEDSEIAEQYGPGEYVWMMKWLGPDQKETGIISEPISVDESARYIHEAYLKKNRASVDSVSTVLPANVQAPAGPTFMDLLTMMEKGEEKAMRSMERMAAIMKPGSESPATILSQAYEGAMKMMQQSLATNLDMAKAASNRVKETMQHDIDEDDMDESDPDEDAKPDAVPAGMPQWLAPFLPQVKNYLGTLLNGGPVGSAVKTIIINSDEWKEIFRDPQKWGVAVAAMEQEFGTETTGKALDILLNRRKEKATPEKAAIKKLNESLKKKGKGK